MRVRYILTLPEEFSPEQVSATLGQVRNYCLDQAFDSIEPIRTNRVAKPQIFDLTPIQRIGFSCFIPGGSLQFWLYQFPKYGNIALPWAHQGTCDLDGKDETYPARHAAVMNSLDYAREIGMGVEVEDPTGFWRHHSKAQLKKILPLIEGFLPI